MEQNSIIVMLDEEISRLRQVRTILHSLLATEARVAPLLKAAEANPEPDVNVEPEIAPEAQPERDATPAVVRHVSRRGISSGRRGPRKLAPVASVRPLDAAVPKAPVVVSRAVLQAAKPVKVVPPPPAPDGTLEAWVRSLKQSRPSL